MKHLIILFIYCHRRAYWSSKPAERPVKITLEEGEPVTGTFINSTSEGVQVLVVRNKITVKWDVIGQVTFTDVQQTNAPAKTDDKDEKQKEAVKTALRSLRKLVAATEVLSWGKRADFEEFGRRFIDVKAEVNEVLPEIAEGEVKNEPKNALDAYDDAITAWKYVFGDNPSGRTSRDMFPDDEPGKILQQKYSIPTYRSGTVHRMEGGVVLNESRLDNNVTRSRNRVVSFDAGGLLLSGIVAMCGIALAANFVSAQEKLPRFESSDCAIERGDWAKGVTLDCGKFLVRETRSDLKSRTLTLPVVIVRAKEQKALPPLVMLHGGPGESGIRMFTPSVSVGPLSRSRDVIIYDQRSAGLASPKLCPEYLKIQLDVRKLKTPEEQERLRDEGRRACKASLKTAGVDINSYNTSVSGVDLIELRQALGIATWDIFAGSYGARLAQEAMRRDSKAIRSVVLQSPATRSPATESDGGLAGENVFKRIFDDCNSQPGCRAAFPTLEKDFFDVYNTLSKDPLAVPVEGKSMVYLDHRRFLGRINNSFGRPARLARVPLLINELRRGDKMRAARSLIGDAGQEGEGDLINQALLQITKCYDSYGDRFLKESKLADERVAEPYRSTQLLNCKEWLDKFSPPSEQEPVVSSIPTLIYTGRYDDRTPIEHARLIASTLKTAYVFEFPDQGHGGRPTACQQFIFAQFWENPMRKPDASCIEQIKPIRFLTSWDDREQ